MRAALAAAALLFALAACRPAEEDAGPAASAVSPAADPATPVAAASSPATPPPASSSGFAVRTDRDLQDRIPGCSGMNPRQRPRGSNCFGIFPEQCGADRAAAFVSQPFTADVRARIEAIAPPGGIRFTRPNEAVTDDLRFERLNVHIDAQGRVEKVDCY
jgi:hypothetical protein